MSVLAWNAQPFAYPLQYSCLENLLDGGAWWAAVHGAAQRHNRATHTLTHTLPLSHTYSHTHTHTHTHIHMHTQSQSFRVSPSPGSSPWTPPTTNRGWFFLLCFWTSATLLGTMLVSNYELWLLTFYLMCLEFVSSWRHNLFEDKNHILDLFLLSTDYPKYFAHELCTINPVYKTYWISERECLR